LYTIIIVLNLFLINEEWNDSYAGLNLRQDSVIEFQELYTGAVWHNNYRRIKGDQFLFSEFFIPADIFINGKVFRNIRIKYDIYEDELITPVNQDNIIELNKEMIDSFKISFEGKDYMFINFFSKGNEDPQGYNRLLFNGKLTLLARYAKTLVPDETNSDYYGYFIQNIRLILVKNDQSYLITSPRSFSDALGIDWKKVRDFLRSENLTISKKVPESYIPVVKYFDNHQ